MAKTIVWDDAPAKTIQWDDEPTAQESPAIAAQPEKSMLSRFLSNAAEGPGAIVEPIAKMLSGFIAPPVANMIATPATAAASLLGRPDTGALGPTSLKNTVQNALTYQPRTAAGASPYNPLNAIPEAISKGLHYVGGAARDFVGQGQAGDTLQGAAGNAIGEAIPQAAGIAGVKYAPQINKAAAFVAEPAFMAGRGARNIYDRLLPGGSNRSVNRLMEDVAGTDMKVLAEELQKAAPGETAGQAAVAVGNREFSALDQVAAKVSPTPYARQIEAQKAADTKFLLHESGSLSKEGQMIVQNAYKEAETAPIVAEGQIELNAANQAGKTVGELQPRANASRQAAATGVQGVRDFTAAAPRAFETPSANNYFPVEGAPRVPGGLSPRANQLSDMANTAAQKGADMSLQQGAQARFIDRQIGSLEAHGLKPLDVGAVVSRIDNIMKSPGLRANTQITSVMEGIKERLAKAVEDGGGIPNAHDIYMIRKEGINQVITDKLKITDPKMAAKLAAEMTSKLKPMIDGAINAAGGTGWTKYLDKYSKAMDRVNGMKLSGRLAYEYQNNPAAFEKIVMGNDPKAVGKMMGSTSPMTLAEAVPEMASKLRGMGMKMARDRALLEQAHGKGIIPGGDAALAKMVNAEVTGGGRLPAMVSREVTITNSILDALHGRASEKTMKQVSEIMRDPAMASKVLMAIQKAKNKQSVTGKITQKATQGAFLPQEQE